MKTKKFNAAELTLAELYAIKPGDVLRFNNKLYIIISCIFVKPIDRLQEFLRVIIELRNIENDEIISECKGFEISLLRPMNAPFELTEDNFNLLNIYRNCSAIL